jgi:hypothetical protein
MWFACSKFRVFRGAVPALRFLKSGLCKGWFPMKTGKQGCGAIWHRMTTVFSESAIL